MLLCLGAPAFGQASNGIQGKVTDGQTGELLPYAMVTLIRDSDKGQRKAMGDSEGHYYFGKVIPGKYTLLVEYKDYATVVTEDITITEDAVTALDFVLRPHQTDPREWEPVAVPTED